MPTGSVSQSVRKHHDDRVRAGDRRHRSEFQSPTSTVVDGMRGRVNTWTTYATFYVSVDVQPFVVSEQNATAIYVVTVPFDDRIRVQQRIVVDTGKSTLRLKVLVLENPELRNRELRLHCAEATDVE